jgi:magnesium transporter
VSEAREQALSLAFMRGHPAQAARVLEALPAEQAAALFARVPARVGAAVLAAMLPSWAARCLTELDDARALDLLAPMGTQPAVAVLRHLPESRRRTLANGLPTTVALASTLMLGYAEDTVGAWADPDIVMLPADTRAADALAHQRSATSMHPFLLVADASRRLAGVVGLNPLLQAPEAATLSTLMQRASAVLSAHAPLAAAVAHPGWLRSSALPVVAGGERLLGVMTRDALARALRQAGGRSELSRDDDTNRALPDVLAHGYWQALSGLVEVSLALLPRVRPVAPTEAMRDGR